MAVVTKYGSGYLDPPRKSISKRSSAPPKAAQHQLAYRITNGDSIASKYLVGTIPTTAIFEAGLDHRLPGDHGRNRLRSRARLRQRRHDDRCRLHRERTDAGVATSVTLRTATGGALATVANQNKRAWELAGLTADPGGELDIWLTINAAATATGNVNFDINYDKAA
jgi:hypothetical protein